MNSDVSRFPATYPGETGPRRCEKCGAEYKPYVRNQKCCLKCQVAKSEPKPKERPKKRKAETFMNDNTLGALNDALFAQLRRIENAEDGEQLESETNRSHAVCNLAANIIANGRLAVTAAQASMGTAEAVSVPRMLLGNGDGK